jgi:DNA-binding transcriptional ArsR family regulator
LSILHLLEQHPAYVSEIVAELGLKQSNVSNHLSTLYDAGLVKRARQGNQIQYSIGDDLVFKLCNLVCQKLHREALSKERVFWKVVH